MKFHLPTTRNLCVVVSIAVLFFSLLAPWSPAAAAADDNCSSKLVIVALGSLTTAPRGPLVVYCDILRKELPAMGVEAEVINAGVSGNTTNDALSRFRRDVIHRGPALVIIQLGINDSTFDVWKNPPADKPRVSPADYEKNLRRMVKTLKSLGTAVILMTPNPMAWTEQLRKLYGKPPYDPSDPDGFNAQLKKYIPIVQRVGEEEGVPVLDVFTAFRTRKDCSTDDLLLDGMHPNDKGQRIVADLLLKQIAKMKDSLKPSIHGEQIHDKAEQLPHKHLGPFVTLADGRVMAADDKCARVSSDGGKTWEEQAIFPKGAKFKVSTERAIIRTKKGTLILAFMNMDDLCFKWDNAKGGPQPGCRLPAYVVRSTDGGKTWLVPQILQDDSWCGYLRSMIQTTSGRIVAAVEKALANPGRHVMFTYVSDDEGATWRCSNAIDIGKPGGYGDHGGTMEGTLVELADGRLYQLLRTRTGRQWETYSDDGGLTWQKPQPSKILSSSSPAMLLRLDSGRIVMLWNRFRDPAKRIGRRDTLSMAFSDDECKSWSEPVIVASNITPPGDKQRYYRQSYPTVFEYKPGELWITTMQGMVRMSLNEKDFLGK
ncbi:MAG: exo-alpha-sialidase [Planctomycetota bacterium]|nr:exo-alpha-sialidase [Planctomycetota bacterium]